MICGLSPRSLVSLAAVAGFCLMMCRIAEIFG